MRVGSRDDARVAAAISAIALVSGTGLALVFFHGLAAREALRA